MTAYMVMQRFGHASGFQAKQLLACSMAPLIPAVARGSSFLLLHALTPLGGSFPHHVGLLSASKCPAPLPGYAQACLPWLHLLCAPASLCSSLEWFCTSAASVVWAWDPSEQGLLPSLWVPHLWPREGSLFLSPKLYLVRKDA